VAALILAQVVLPTPLNPLTLGPQTATPQYVWGTAIFGYPPTSITGNYTPPSDGGHTFLLNNIRAGEVATARYNISFLSLLDLNGHANFFDLYVSAQLAFNDSSSSLLVQVGNHNPFHFHDLQRLTVPWNRGYPVYVPSNSSPNLVANPGPYRVSSNLPFLHFHLPFPDLAQNDSVWVTITAPAQGQIYLSDIVLTAGFDAAPINPPTSTVMGLVTLPFLGAAVAGFYYFARRFSAGKYLGTLAAAFALQVVLAPLFMHADLAILQRYDSLYFNYDLVNLQSWTYGILWLGTILLPPAPAFVAGVTPSLALWSLMIKLPAIAADLLTFLVLLKILEPRIGVSKSYWVATVGWLFNPLVLYLVVIHGLGESVIALFVTLAAYAFLNRRFWVGIAGTVAAALTILPAACVAAPVLFARRVSWPQRIALVVAPVAVYVLVFLALYHSADGLWPYLVNLLRRTNYTELTLGAASRSVMTYLFLIDSWFGIYLSPLLGVALLVIVCVVLLLRGRELLPEHALLAVYGSLLAFYLTYEVFYVQHWIWAIPAFTALVAFVPNIEARTVAIFVTVVSLLALVINVLTTISSTVVEVLAWVLFAWLLVPIVLWIPGEFARTVPMRTVRPLARVAGAVFGFALLPDIISFSSVPNDVIVPAALAGVAFLFLVSLPAGPRTLLRLVVVGVAEAAAVVAPLVAVYEIPRSLVPAALFALGGLLAMAMLELLFLTVRWIRMSATAPLSAPPATPGTES
jgi:hypothetical protein